MWMSARAFGVIIYNKLQLRVSIHCQPPFFFAFGFEIMVPPMYGHWPRFVCREPTQPYN